jgi:hypothetical protein
MVFNPLKVTKNSVIEFSSGTLRGTGLYRFKKIIEFNVGGKIYSRYLIYSNVDDAEYIFEVFTGNNNNMETYVYKLSDTVPFSEDFLYNVAGQKFLTTPDGIEYERSIMPNDDARIEPVSGKIRIYNLESDTLERTLDVRLWDYKRDADGRDEYLNVEMAGDNGMFKIFIGEMIEEIFYSIMRG